MANKQDMWPDNDLTPRMTGAPVFYCDSQCIVCAVCSDAAPENFRESDEQDHYICHKQPESGEELDRCREAMENCPVEAIGDDG